MYVLASKCTFACICANASFPTQDALVQSFVNSHIYPSSISDATMPLPRNIQRRKMLNSEKKGEKESKVRCKIGEER